MGFLGDTLDFEKSRWLGDGGGLDEIKDNPWRMLGHTGPVGTYLSNKLLGRDDEPLHDMWGNATDEQFERAEEKGIDTEASHQGYDLADSIAKMFAGGYGMGQLSGGASAGGGYSPSWMDWAQTGMSQFGGGGEQAPAGQPAGQPGGPPPSPQGLSRVDPLDEGERQRQVNRLLYQQGDDTPPGVVASLSRQDSPESRRQMRRLSQGYLSQFGR